MEAKVAKRKHEKKINNVELTAYEAPLPATMGVAGELPSHLEIQASHMANKHPRGPHHFSCFPLKLGQPWPLHGRILTADLLSPCSLLSLSYRPTELMNVCIAGERKEAPVGILDGSSSFHHHANCALL